MSRCTHHAASDTRVLLAGLLRRPQAHPARRTSTRRRGVAPLVLAGVVFAAGWLAAARAGEAQSVIAPTGAAGDAVGGSADNAHTGAASGFSAGSGYLYWDNPQVGWIGRGTIDGDPANVNQSFLTGMLPGLDAHPVAVDRQHFYWGWSSWIGRANLDGSGVNQKFISLGEYSAATQLAVDDQHVYFIRGDVSIGRANLLDGSGVEESFITVQGAAFAGLAVDSNYIYWTDSASGHQSIGRANLDGTGVTPSFIAGTGLGRGVAVDGQHIYWGQLIPGGPYTQPPHAATIGQANLDGTGMIWNFITGATQVSAVAVDFGHVYWANYYDCNYETDPPSSCAGGTIGRANLDGSEVNQSFITAYAGTGSGCSTGENNRCGPSSVAVSAPTQPACLRTSPPPAPPIGGAVFAQALDPGGSDANVVVIPAGMSWTAAGSCAGIAQGAAEVMTHPTSISVAPDVAVLLSDQPAGLFSAWGARDVGADDPVPVLFPGRSDWQTTEADILPPQQLLGSYNGCPGCLLPNNLQLTPEPPNSNVAYQGDLSGATLIGATLTGSFTGWNFSGTQLPGSTINGADVSGANFSGADLRGAHLAALPDTPPPTFVNVRVGSFNGSCTVFQNTNLVGTGFEPVQADLLVPGCEDTPLLPGSTAPLDLIALLAHTYQATVDFANARFLVTAANRHVLAGVDLHAIDLAGASFVGFPADFKSTNFNGASLQKTSFELADLTGATFQGAQAAGASFEDATLNGAQFNSATTILENADFVQANVSSASFQNADISQAVFDRALADGTSFNSVIAKNARFDGAHIYGDGEAFNGARELTQADFVGAVLAGSVDGAGGFNLTNADLTDANFDNVQCIACNFTGSTLTGATLSGAFLPGAVLSGVLTLQDASFDNAWLYCGESDDACKTGDAQPQWPLVLGVQESYGPVPFTTTTLTQGEWTDVTVCPDGTPPNAMTGCQDHLLPDDGVPTIPAPCSAAALDACPTPTSTLFDAGTLPAGPIAVVPATPATWTSSVTTQGYYVGLTDGTVRLVGGGGPAQVVAGSHNTNCTTPTQPCGDNGPASQALLGSPNGLAVGLDGSLYVADPTLHRVRRIDPSGTITTLAGTGLACSSPSAVCGDGGPAAVAALDGPDGVWASPSGELFIADGPRGIREVLPNGNITSIGPTPGTSDVISVAGDAAGNLYAATNSPDYLLQINLTSGQVTPVVGTGTSGYNGNGNTDTHSRLLPGTQVQINHPGGLSVALNGDVVFADSANHLIRAYVPSNGHVIDDLGGLISNGLPKGGFNGDGQWADQTKLQNPAAVTVTRGALLVIADTGNSRVRQIGPSPLPPQLGGIRSASQRPIDHPQNPRRVLGAKKRDN